MNQQLASDFYPIWNSSSPAAGDQPNVLRKIMQRLGLAGRRHRPAAHPDAHPAGADPEFFKPGEDLLRRSRSASQPLSIIVFELHDLPELESVFGRKVAQRVIAQALAGLQRVAGRKGLARRMGPTTFAVLLPQMRVEGSLATIHAAFGRGCCIEVEAGGEEIVLVPDFRVRTVREGHSVQAEYESLRSEIAQERDRRQRHLEYLERERATHSSPMHLQREWARTQPADFARSVVSLDLHAQIPPTVPVPIGLR